MSFLLRIIIVSHLVIPAFIFSCTSPKEAKEYDLVIYGGRVIDPETNTDSIFNIGINEGTIAKVSKDSLIGKSYINASGLVVSPGFIDLHEHGATDETYKIMAHDGVTTAFELELGTGDVANWFKEREGGQVVNYGVSIGHIKVRMNVFNDPGTFTPKGKANTDKATEEQIAEMEKQIEEGLKNGAVAVGFGLAYTPGATTEEFKAMLGVAKKFGASSHIHLRGGLAGLNEAINSAIEVGTPLHIVHINSSGGAQTSEFLKIIKEAQDKGHDITTEAYPYEAGMTAIESAIFDGWQNWDDEKIGIHQWVETGEFLNRETFGKYREQGGRVIIHSRTEEMTLSAIESPLTMIASDGLLEDGKGHPRTSGTYSKVLGKYVRELHALTLQDAVRKMTIEPAKRLEGFVPAMKKKGRLQEGADADITIFDPTLVIDQSTYSAPTLSPKGIPYVIIAGKIVIDQGKLVPGVKPGKAIKKL
ncbi:MAG: amidohydrolase family protein [Cyclobacteriaceae bacterium]|nr:amidohydrolase family protein [Cyclobacteriaceae bacterium]